MDLSGIQVTYNERKNTFLEHDIFKDPLKLFDKWFQEAKESPTIQNPNAMVLATATKNGFPSARMVMLKACNEEGFQFYTQYTSRKGRELEENPNVALTFYWSVLNKSIRIEGVANKLPMCDAEKYFDSLPYEFQIGALYTEQSRLVECRLKLKERMDEFLHRYEEGNVPKPPQWGGYTVVPKSIEFWQGQTDRIHDRIKFRQAEHGEIPDNVLTHNGTGKWIYERLQP